ncbi:uncharacterized protein PRCAT00003379001 [Priceomyces carsonii]|uniref:uncharacterized protein n=1 Tax=Priceomyces carsonii TaxID=28549 RepID=UPI002ED8F233|nr:unnamed protein product [Priceomyces carsonii]
MMSSVNHHPINISQFFDTVNKIQITAADRELHWFVKDVILSEFPQIVEALEICSNLVLYNSPQHPDPENRVERGPPVKLPVSSPKLETLKGIIVRDGAYVTQLSVSLKEPHFNKVLHKLQLKKPLLLDQIITTKKSIDRAMELIKEAQKTLNCTEEDHNALVTTFKTLMGEIKTAKNSLQLPTDPALVFPINVTPSDAFEPELTPNISFDLYISQAEVCIDLKNLHRIQDKPWSNIDENGKSYIDKLRDEMKLPSTHSTTTPASTPIAPSQPLNMADIEDRLNQISTIPPGQRSTDRSKLFSDIISHLLLKPKYDPIDFITKCITYNNMVVTINKKIEVSSPDPILVSAFTKLDSIEYLVSSFLENLQKVMDD